jgi:hypothetical protein
MLVTGFNSGALSIGRLLGWTFACSTAFRKARMGRSLTVLSVMEGKLIYKGTVMKENG